MNRKSSTTTMHSSIPTQEIQQLVSTAERVLVLSHIDPDGDALGSTLAFAEYLTSIGKEAVLLRQADSPEKYSFLPGTENIVHFDELATTEQFDLAIVLECPSYERIGKAATFLTAGLPVINIDHHYESGDFGDVRWIDPKRSSVGEMIFEFFTAIQHPLSKVIATQLYTAILTDTGRFRYQATSQRTMEIAGALIGAGADPKYICDKVYFNLKQSTMQLTSLVLGGIEFHENGRLCFLTLTHEMFRKADADPAESDGLIDYTMFTDKVVAGVLVKEGSEDYTRVSLRSRDGINVAEIASLFGGGGHYNASGCTVPQDIEKTKTTMLKLLSEKING